ncbi:MAG: tRNA lysidine(34) synthetase TilS [Actinomycetota bacterium]|nr:tRNA lysidine(34) synthetase TilS [Actinomycetota bacterium]
MIEPGDGVIVAVSGGPDSTALLFSLSLIRDKYDLRLHVWHLNHLIRPEAREEADHVRRLASRLELPCTIEERDVKAHAKKTRRSVQEAGRELRYALLEQLSGRLGASKIAVGHNANDCVETFFINLLRGAGAGGLSGIPPVTGKIIRPLIESERSTIVQWLTEQGIDYLTDSSNADKRYLRNRVRLELMPALLALSPAATEKITTTMSLLRDEETWLAELSRKSFREVAVSRDGEVRLDGARLAQAPPALKRRLLRLAIADLAGSTFDIDYATVQSIIDKTLAGGGPTNFSGGGRAMMSGQDLILAPVRAPFISAFIDSAGGEAQIDHVLISVTITSLATVVLPPDKGVLVVDADKIDWPLEIRPRRPGDWFVPLGMTGKKKLHDFLVDEKVPRRLRDSVPIFVDRKKLAAVGNLRIDERAKVSARTKQVAILRAPDVIY